MSDGEVGADQHGDGTDAAPGPAGPGGPVAPEPTTRWAPPPWTPPAGERETGPDAAAGPPWTPAPTSRPAPSPQPPGPSPSGGTWSPPGAPPPGIRPAWKPAGTTAGPEPSGDPSPPDAAPEPTTDRGGTGAPAPHAGPTLLVTVTAPGGTRTATRVAADVPVAQLAAGLGRTVDVAGATRLLDRQGRPIPGTSTLAGAGITNGSTVQVVPGPGTPTDPVAPTTPTDPVAPSGPAPASTVDRTAAPRRSAPAGAAPFTAAPRRPRSVPLPVAVVAVVVAAVAFFVLGGVVLGGGSTPSGPGPIAARAAGAWLRALPFPPDRAASVPAGLGRRGPLTGTLEPAGSWHHGSRAGETFVVAVTNGPTLGLTVVTAGGKLDYPPTVGPLPFVVGQRPPAPGASTTPGGAVPQPVRTWAAAVYGPQGVLPPLLGFGLAGAPRVIETWTAAAGGTVVRVQLPLDSAAPGTPGGKAAGAAHDIAGRVSADNQRIGADQSAVTAATTDLGNARRAAAVATPPNPPPLAAAVTAASAALAAANQRLAADRAALSTDKAAAARAAAAPSAGSASALATYDVWVRATKVIGWDPAGYDVAS